MEATFEGFSIREYVARMRREDASKCWPFEGGGQLPPIECRRYRWWSSELQIARSSGACEQKTGAAEYACVVEAPKVRVAEVVGGREASSSMLGKGGKLEVRQSVLVLPDRVSGLNVNDVGDEEPTEARSPGKAKLRTTKKRSIVELFAVAPQIGAADAGDDGGKVLDSHKAKAPEEQTEDEAHGKDSVEEAPVKKKDMSGKTRKKKIKRNFSIQNKENEKVKKKRKKKTKTKMTLKQQQQMLLRKRKQKNIIKMGAPRKEKLCKLNLRASVDFTRIACDLTIVKGSRKEKKLLTCEQKKKPTRTKGGSKNKKLKVVQTSKMKKDISESNSLSIHSILKNQEKTCVLKKLQKIDNSQNGEGHHAQQSEKHVRFSGKDDIFCHGGNFCSPLGSPQIQSLCKVFSDVLAASSEIQKLPESGKLPESNSKQQMLTVNEDDVPGCAENVKISECLQQSTNIHGLNDEAASANFAKNHAKKKRALDDCINLNSKIKFHCDLNQIDPCSTEPYFRVTHPQERCFTHFLNETGNRTCSVDAGGSLPSESASAVMVANMQRNSNLELAMSSSADVASNRGLLYPVENGHEDIYTYDSQFHSSGLIKRDMLNTFYSGRSTRQLYHMDDFQRSRSIASPGDNLHDKHSHAEVIGLPVTSQGEYICLQSSTQFGFEQLPKKQNNVLGTALPYNSVLPDYADYINFKGKILESSTSPQNQQKWASEGGQPTVMPVYFSNDLQGIKQADVRKKTLVECDQFESSCDTQENLFRVPYGFMEKRESRVHNDRALTDPGSPQHGSEPMNRPTMRLMGKDFTVGSCNKNMEHQGSCHTHVWSDKKTRDDLVPVSRVQETAPNHWLLPEWHIQQRSVSSYENIMHTMEIQNYPSTCNFYHVTSDPQFDSDHCDYAISGNVCHSASFNYGQGMDPVNHPHAPEACLNKPLLGKKICEPECETAKMRFQTPFAVYNPGNISQDLALTSTSCKHNQSISGSETSPFAPASAFQNSENGKSLEYPFAQSSSRTMSRRLPHWLIDSGQNKNAFKFPALSLSDSISKHEFLAKSGNSIFPLPMPSKSVTSFPFLGQKSNVFHQDLPASASLVHTSAFPSHSATRPSYTNSTYYCTLRSNRDDMKSRYSFVKSFDFVNKTRKRPAPGNNDFIGQIKRINLSIPVDSKAQTGLHACTEEMSKVIDLHSYGKETAVVNKTGSYAYETVKVNDARSFGDEPVKVNDTVKLSHESELSDISKLDIGLRPGPLKLSAGAKHILKPSLNMDQDRSVPTHSTIPFARGTGTGRLPVSQKKPAKIYQL